MNRSLSSRSREYATSVAVPLGSTYRFDVSMRGDSEHIYDILDDDLNVVREVSIHDFAKALAEW
jgi:hypothetical protein